MIKGNGKFRYIWDLLIAMLATYCSIEIPFRLVMNYPANSLISFADHLVIIAFIADLFVNFRSSIMRNGKWTADPKIISKKYLASWFIIDLIAAIPFEYILLHAASPLFLMARLPKMLKLFNLINFKSKWEYTINFNPGLIRLALFFYFMGIGIHWISCGWLEIRIIETGADMIKEYVKALYWSMTTVTTIGYGDITPDRERIIEMVYTMIIQVLGAGAYGYIIGNIASLLANIDLAKVHHQERVDRIISFMRSKKFPVKLQERVHNYFNYLWESREGYDDSAVLEELPESFKLEFALLLNKGILEKVPMFKGADPNLIKEIVLFIKPCVYTPGDNICTYGEIGNKMYFINKGTVEVVSEDGSKVYATLKDGDFFGELALLLMQPRNATIRAVDYCDLYSLDKESFDTAIHHYPEFEKYIKEMAAERMNKKS